MSYVGLYDDAGSKNAFYIIKDKKIDRKRIGFKEFESKKEAEFAYRIQKILADKDLAPRVYGQVGKIRRSSNNDLTSYGYLTEVARPMPQCYSDYCDGECYDADCDNSCDIRCVVEYLSHEGLEYADAHRGNFGYVKRKNEWVSVVIDLGIESFSYWDSSIYGEFDYDEEEEYSSEYSCNCYLCQKNKVNNA